MAEGNRPPLSGVPRQSGFAPPPPPRPPPALGTRPPPPPFHGTRPPPPPSMGSQPPLPSSSSVSQAPPPPPPPEPASIQTGSHDDKPRSQDQDTESKKQELPALKDRGSKVKMGFGVLGKRAAPMSGGGGPFSIKMKSQADTVSKKAKTEPTVQSKPSSKLVAQAFGSDSEEEEEMPPEAKLRMRNIGKDTPTSAGPNSFYKTTKGFTDPRGSWRGELEKD